MEDLKFGIAGFGKMGRIRAESIFDFRGAELVCIFDKNNENIDSKVNLCASFDQLLDSDLDGVFISTYVDAAADYVLRALRSGKHVFCEKPPSLTRDQLLEIKEFQLDSNLVLKYGFNHRFHYSVIEAKKLIHGGTMGNLLWMRGVYGKAGSLDFKENWRNYKEYSGGGILMDQGIHMLDLFRFFSGEEFSCKASYLDTVFWDIENEDNAFVILESESGIISSLHSTANQWKHKFLLELTFENGFINLDGILSTTGSYAPEKIIYSYRDQEDVTKGMGRPLEISSIFEVDNSWKYELQEFYNAIKGLGTVKNGTINDAFQIMSLIEDIYSSNLKR